MSHGGEGRKEEEGNMLVDMEEKKVCTHQQLNI